jgi:dihydrofolate reductase
MRKIVMLNRVSVDGFYAGPNGEIDWFIHDPEVDRAAHGNGISDTLLLGRHTYQMFESYWPPIAADPTAPEGSRVLSRELNQMTKVVFSKTLSEVTWENSVLVKNDIVQAVRDLKVGPGEGIGIFGSGSVVQQLTAAGLIDEFLIIVTPVILGAGKPLFTNHHKINLKLLKTWDFNSGNVMLHYTLAGD